MAKKKKRARSRAHRTKRKATLSRKAFRKVRSASRSRASKKGWATRHKRQQREFQRRSKASKKGWRQRKAKERIAKQAKQKPTGKGKLREWIVNFSYHGKKAIRVLALIVIAKSGDDAILFCYRAIAKGKDSRSEDLEWAGNEAENPIPWDEVEASLPVTTEEREMTNEEIKERGEGWVEIH